jgi:predicted RNA methylase
MILGEISPACVILDMIDHAGICSNAVFYDLGSGLGQPAMLVNLLCGARCVGIEYQPSYHQFACDRLEMLGLEDVSYFNEDARDADFSQGTHFFLFSPFKGSILDQVLDKLHIEALEQQIRICTFGSCVNTIGQLDWLRLIYPGEPGEYKLVVFESV